MDRFLYDNGLRQERLKLYWNSAPVFKTFNLSSNNKNNYFKIIVIAY